MIIPKIEKQFLEFPNGDHDDIIDCLSQAVEVFRYKGKKRINTAHKKPVDIDPILNNMQNIRTGSGALS